MTYPPPGHLGPGHSRERAQLLGQARGDLPRRAAQRLGQIEGGGESEVPQVDPGRVLEGDTVERDVEGAARCLADRAGKALLQIDDHDL